MIEKSRLNSIKFKLSFIVGVGIFLFSIILTFYFTNKHRKTVLAYATDKLFLTGKNISVALKIYIDKAFDNSRTLAQICRTFKANGAAFSLNRFELSAILKQSVMENEQFLGVYAAWEPNAFDNEDAAYSGKENEHPDGHFVPYWWRDDQNGMHYEPLKYYLVPGKGDYYLIPRETREETIIEPISYLFGKKYIQLITVVVPITASNGDFLGVIGTDISTQSMQDEVQKIKMFDGYSHISIISNKGIVVVDNIDSARIGKSAEKYFSKQVLKSVTALQSNVQNIADTITCTMPIYLGKATVPWYVIVRVPLAYITKDLWKDSLIILVICLIVTGLLVWAMYVAVKKLLDPIRKISRIAQKLAKGNLDVWKVSSTSTEIELLNQSFENVVQAQREITNVCMGIASGDFSKEAVVKSDQDVLAKSVNQMIAYLKQSSEEEVARRWASEGYAQFSELLRKEDTLKGMTETLLRFLIKYTGSNQGSIFLHESTQSSIHTLSTEMNASEGILKLYASYAYERLKYIDKELQPGEGLLGQVFLEGEYMLLTDVPKDFVTITSGLGEATPTCVIIVPMKSDDKVVGVLEIASFKVFTGMQVQFFLKCAESMAGVVHTIRVSEFTKKLLADTQAQSEQMRMQEEEMRQNLEELAATQEEMVRKEKQYVEKIDQLTLKLEQYQSK